MRGESFKNVKCVSLAPRRPLCPLYSRTPEPSPKTLACALLRRNTLSTTYVHLDNTVVFYNPVHKTLSSSRMARRVRYTIRQPKLRIHLER